LNALKQGLGKTYESIQTINQLFTSKEVDRVLIVGISSILYNWKREFLAFSSFKEEDILIVNKDNRDIFDHVENLPKVLIMSYNTFRLVSDYHFSKKIKDKKALKEKLKGYRTPQIPFDQWGINRVIICDEAHKMKNIDTRWTKLLHYHKIYFEYRYLLSGTPHPNHIGELYSLIKFLDDNLVEDSYNEFLSTIAVLGNKFSAYAIDHFIDYKVNLFLERIKPYILRRFLRDHLELPQISEKEVYIELTGKQKLIYQQLVSESLIKIKEEKGKITYRDIEGKFPFILQILSDPCLLQGKILSKQSNLQHMIDTWKFENSLKFTACKELLEEIFDEKKDSKVVIWSEHPRTIEQLASAFEKYGTVIVHGKSTPKGWTSDKWRDHVVNEFFKNDPTKKLLIANPATLGTGTNMQYVQNVITYDELFSFTDVDQKKSRFERQGMIGSVTYYKLIIDHTIEVYQNKIMKNKELQDKQMLVEGMTIQDLQNIFNGKA
jgi:SNF2 family DNA or RNA helicase